MSSSFVSLPVAAILRPELHAAAEITVYRPCGHGVADVAVQAGLKLRAVGGRCRDARRQRILRG